MPFAHATMCCWCWPEARSFHWVKSDMGGLSLGCLGFILRLPWRHLDKKTFAWLENAISTFKTTCQRRLNLCCYVVFCPVVKRRELWCQCQHLSMSRSKLAVPTSFFFFFRFFFAPFNNKWTPGDAPMSSNSSQCWKRAVHECTALANMQLSRILDCVACS